MEAMLLLATWSLRTSTKLSVLIVDSLYARSQLVKLISMVLIQKVLCSPSGKN